MKQTRRNQLRAQPFPPAWGRMLEARCPFYSQLPAADRRELEGHIQVFLAEKHFEGCGGLNLTQEMRVCIAAQACLLLLHRDTDYYPDLRSILVYPSGYLVKTTRPVGAAVLEESYQARLGEAWQQGAVVLAWDAVCQGTADPTDGHNLVFHEFAHQLDFEDGRADGAPVLASGESPSARRSRYAAWARVSSTEFEQLRAQVRRGQAGLLDPYGATDPAEFFAVATESFFERPREMVAEHPELYAELKQFYRQDPAHWCSDIKPQAG